MLAVLQDALLHSPVLLQAYSTDTQQKVKTKLISFPLEDNQCSDDIEQFAFDMDKVKDLFCLTSCCGYVTLANFQTTEKQQTSHNDSNSSSLLMKVEEEKLNDEQLSTAASADATSAAVRQQSPAGELMTADSEQLLTEELDAIDCPMAGQTSAESAALPAEESSADKSPLAPPAVTRPNKLCIDSSSTGTNNHVTITKDNWTLVDITFGVPLFDAELNGEIVKKILCHDLVKRENLDRVGRHFVAVEQEFLSFIRLVS